MPSTRKYQNHGGPSALDILHILRGGDTPEADQMAFFKSQVLFWLIGATDGHAKNFSVQLGPSGTFQLTPFYDVLTTQPAVDDHQIRHNQFKLAMSLGDSKHYDIFGIRRRHFIETAMAASLSAMQTEHILDDIKETAQVTLDRLAAQLPDDFPAFIHESVSNAVRARLRCL